VGNEARATEDGLLDLTDLESDQLILVCVQIFKKRMLWKCGGYLGDG
jgi:hypothetical protein